MNSERATKRSSVWHIMPRYFSSPVDTVVAAFRRFRREPRAATLGLGASENRSESIEGSETGRVSGGKAPSQDNTANRAPETSNQTLIAFRVSARPCMRLTPASSARPWMLATNEQFANRCLPLLIANQAGWFFLNSHPIRVTWDGGNEIRSIHIEYLNGSPPYPAVSHFGHGIVTWRIPYLLRTAPDYNLLVRGPSNWPKDGAHPLEGIVETDWSVGTFTMNWMLTRPNQPVVFEVDEPICMIVPQRRGELESFHPRVVDLRTDKAIQSEYHAWNRSREQFLKTLNVAGSSAMRQKWQKHYFRGVSPLASRAGIHQTKLSLREFSSNQEKETTLDQVRPQEEGIDDESLTELRGDLE
jgi:Family of unknown function (DUF6065)